MTWPDADRRKQITGAQLKQLSDAWEVMPFSLQPTLTAEQRSEDLRLAQNHLLTAYDAVYLELAMRLELPLASLDASFNKVAKAPGVKTVMA